MCRSSLVGWSDLQLDGALCSKQRWVKDEIVCLIHIYIYIYKDELFFSIFIRRSLESLDLRVLNRKDLGLFFLFILL